MEAKTLLDGIRLLKAPDWNTPLTPAQVRDAGKLATTLPALAVLIEKADILFRDPANKPRQENCIQIETGHCLKAVGRNEDVSHNMVESQATCKPTLRILYSAVHLHDAIEEALTVSHAQEFYENLQICLRYYPLDDDPRRGSGVEVKQGLIVTSDGGLQKVSMMEFGYMGAERLDGPRTADLVGQVRSVPRESAKEVFTKLGEWATAQAIAPYTRWAERPKTLETALTRWAKRDSSIRQELSNGGGKGGAKWLYKSELVLRRFPKP